MSTQYEPPQPQTGRNGDQSVGQLLRELSEETSTLVRQEVQLAKAELSEKAKLAGKGAGLLAGAAVMGLALLGAFTAFLIAVIALALPVWLAALAVTVLYALITAVLGLAGRAALRKATPATPEQTIDTVKEDVQWAKTQAKSAKR
ncbi:MAG: phage holin family protein [Actinomycetota bacterium]|nr:phage holin family protein [Acidothermales bacterium]MDQ3430997.1 phage holin family protein [Actinomycetota bacterium]